MNKFRFIYQKDGKIFGSTSTVPTSSDVEIPELNKIFGLETESVSVAELTIEEPVIEQPKVKERKAKKEIVEEILEVVEPEEALTAEEVEE